jgi:hypothetical protein
MTDYGLGERDGRHFPKAAQLWIESRDAQVRIARLITTGTAGRIDLAGDAIRTHLIESDGVFLLADTHAELPVARVRATTLVGSPDGTWSAAEPAIRRLAARKVPGVYHRRLNVEVCGGEAGLLSLALELPRRVSWHTR